jgi:transcriptional regulator with XRE-family HTH domain
MVEKSELAVKVGAEIRRLRLERHRSQEDFADDCRIHRTSMGAIERGERVITINTAKRVVRTLGMTLGEFFAGVGE